MEDKTISSLFENFHNVSDLLVDLFIYKGLQRKDGRTLLFIDEIQNSPKAVASLRYFYEEIPHIFVIAAGSLLESLIDVHLSFPVGRVEYMAIHPFSFREYLEAIGDGLLKDRISNSPITSIPFHDKLIHSFNRYALIGGMPEVVKTFIENQDILSLSDVYESLIQCYKDDVEKYETFIRTTFDYSFKTQENIPDIYKPLYHIWDEFKAEPYLLHQQLIQWKFDAYASLLSKETCSSRCRSFGLDQIIVYCAQYDLLESEERKKPTSYMSFINRIYKVEEK